MSDRYQDITFDINLCGSEHSTRVIGKARRELVALKTMAGARMSQRILVILILSVIEYGFGMFRSSSTQLTGRHSE